jgi:hypothetical protein
MRLSICDIQPPPTGLQDACNHSEVIRVVLAIHNSETYLVNIPPNILPHITRAVPQTPMDEDIQTTFINSNTNRSRSLQCKAPQIHYALRASQARLFDLHSIDHNV